MGIVMTSKQTPPTTAARADASAESAMGNPNLREFVNYLWGQQGPDSYGMWPVVGVVLTGLQKPGSRSIPGFHLNRLPAGMLCIYPEWVAFLTHSKNQPGVIPGGVIGFTKLVAAAMWESYRPIIKLSTRISHPFMLGVDVVQWLNRDPEDDMKKAVANPNSFFLQTSRCPQCQEGPLSHGAVYGVLRWQPGVVRRHSPRQNAIAMLKHSFGGSWHAEAEALLREPRRPITTK